MIRSLTSQGSRGRRGPCSGQADRGDVWKPFGRGSVARGFLAETKPLLRAAVLLVLTSCVLTGCSTGAPSFELFGAYFPAWMWCALIGVLGAVGTRVALATQAANGVIPLQLGVCVAVGVITALLIWIALFR